MEMLSQVPGGPLARPGAALVTGATGAIGRRLVSTLERPRVLSRDAARAAKSFSCEVDARAWDPEVPLDPAHVEGVDVVFHLAGEPVAAHRWTDDVRRRILSSRVAGTRRIVEAIGRAEQRPRVLVSASAVGIYGSRGDEILDESAAPGTGFLADVCLAWEAAAREAERFGVRVVRARIGVVLLEGEGALGKMLPIFRLGVGGPLGSGRQWMPWIHVADVIGILRRLATAEIAGAVNVVSPEPVTNRDFSRALGRALRRPAILRAPESALRIALGDMADVVLASQRVLPAAIRDAGYAFQFPELHAALADVVGRRENQEVAS
jgi:uncharacterized protein (TIGR01777 family)